MSEHSQMCVYVCLYSVGRREAVTDYIRVKLETSAEVVW